MLTAVLHILAIAALAGGWVLAGYALLPARLRRDEGFLVFSTSLALGAGLTAVAVTVAAAAGAMNRPALWGIQAGVTMLAVRGALVRRREGRKHAFLAWRRPWPQRMAMAALLVVAAATLLATLAPPSSMDATVYHLRMPQLFLRAGRWVALPDIVQSFQPLYVQMLFGHAMALGDDVLASLSHWALGIGAVATAGACSRRLGGSALWGMMIFGVSAIFTWESTSAFIDLGLACFTSLALLWATRPEVGGPSSVLAGLFAGLAAGSKLTGAFGAALAAAAAFHAAAPDWRAGARRALTIAGLAFVLALPWYIRNAAATGNPFYPVGNTLLRLPPQTLASVWYGHGTSLLHLLRSPFDLAWRGDAFDKGWSLGPAYLALLPLGAALTWRTQVGRAATAAVALWWLFWFVTSQQTRLLLPVAPLAAGLAAVGARGALASAARPLRWAAAGTLTVAAGLGAAVALLAAASHARVALGVESRTDYLRRTSWHYVAFEQANTLLPPDARVAVVSYWATNFYYLQREAQSFKTLPPAATLRRLRLTHVLDIEDCTSRATPAAPADRQILWASRYAVVRSRLQGGAGETMCALLYPVADATAAVASTRPSL